MAKIDPSKAHLSEEDIENWIYENPNDISSEYQIPVRKWVARQFKVPSGIIDLLGVDEQGSYLVLEIKNTKIASGALTQVSRYAEDITEIIQRITNRPLHVRKVVIGTEDVSDELMFEANALGIRILTFVVFLNLKISGIWSWTDRRDEQISNQYDVLARDNAFSLLRTLCELQGQDNEDTDETGILEEARKIIEEESENTDDESD